jgi:hypothetical protein
MLEFVVLDALMVTVLLDCAMTPTSAPRSSARFRRSCSILREFYLVHLHKKFEQTQVLRHAAVDLLSRRLLIRAICASGLARWLEADAGL